MNNLLKQDQEKLKLFKKYGYDIPRARNFILAKARISGGNILEVGTGRGHAVAAGAQAERRFRAEGSRFIFCCRRTRASSTASGRGGQPLM